MSLTDRELAKLNQQQVQSGTPIARVGNYAGADAAAYHDVVSWTVAALKVGKLKELSYISDNFPKTHWKLSIGGVQQFTDTILQSALTQPFPRGNRLATGAVVLVQAKSTDGTAVNAQGSIAGSER